MQYNEQVQPTHVNLVDSVLKLQKGEAPFLKGYRLAFGKNKQGKQGGNFGQGKKMQSNWQNILLDLPKSGLNQTYFFGLNKVLNEAYHGVWNSLGYHTIYILYGDSMTSQIVYRGANLDWTLDPKNKVPEHRIHVRMVYDVADMEQRHVREKFLIFTDGHGWQRWINVIASIATDSFNATKFPYFKLYGPHFDKDEFIDYPVRPPMYAPMLTALPRTDADKGKQTLLLNKVTQLAYRYLLTDGRASTISPHSNPFYVSKSSCSSSRTLTRAVDVAMNAGSAHVERIQLLVKNKDGDWMLYDTIDKFDSSGTNAPDVIGDQYWKRTNPWAKFSFDQATNTIHYTYAGDLQATLFPKNDALDFYNDAPIRSVALTAAGDRLLWCNNLYNYNNLSTEKLEKFNFTVKEPVATDACSTANAKIVLYAFMARRQRMGNNPGVYGQVAYISAPGQTTVKFGGLNVASGTGEGFFPPMPQALEFDEDESNQFNLNFGDNGNFICHLAGTPYTAIGVQYAVDAAGNLTKVGNFDKTNAAQLETIRNLYQAQGFYVQRFEFNVPAGKYVARLARHDADITSDYASTSTYVQGVVEHSKVYAGNNFATNPVTNFTKEILIDSTAGNVDVWGKGEDLFYIMPPLPYQVGSGVTGSGDPDWRFNEGYVIEDTDTRYPMEGLVYKNSKGRGIWSYTGMTTDHNGFFFGYAADDDGNKAEIQFEGYYGCSTQHYLFSTVTDGANRDDSGYYPGRIVSAANTFTNVEANNRILVKGKVVDCTSGLGLPSVGVTLSGTRTYYTDSNGEFEIVAHEAPNGNRTGNIYFNTGGECLFKSCDCSPIATVPFATANLSCVIGQPRETPEFTVNLKVLVQSGRGLKEGGRFGFGAAFEDLAGRPTFIQEMQYLDIPSFLETGVFSPSLIQWSVTGKLNLPAHVKYFTFFRTANRNAQTYIQWVGDSISFIDNKGNTTVNGNGAIRAKVTLQSLLDFNIKNNFNTNVTYQFTQGDILRVYDDGDGNLFDPKVTDGYLDYQILGTDYNQTVEAYAQGNVATATKTVITDSDGNVTTENSSTIPNPNADNDGASIIIEYDERLLELKDKTGFWIEVIRPKDITSIEEYTEIIGTVPVVDGEPVFTTGELDTFDSYFQTRYIRIPNALGKSLGHPFVSSSISDYWGANVHSGGRSLVKDPQAKQTWYANESIVSDEIVNDGRVNGLGRCRSVNRKNFKGQAFGGIVAVHAERNRLVFICENDYFICDYDLNYVKVTAQGLIQATLDQVLSDPYPKEGFNYGCAYEDTSSIKFYDGNVYWADRYNSSVVMLDKSKKLLDISDQKVRSYFINKFNAMAAFNASLSNDKYLSELMEIIAGIDPQTGEYNLTFRPRYGISPDPQYFVNDEREIFYDMQETFIYNPDFGERGAWVSFAGYAPEFYGMMPNAKSGIEMLSFAAGDAWFHNTIGKTGSLKYYGVNTNQVVELALNIDEEKVKIYQAAAVSSPDTKYFIDRVITENPNLFSYVPLAHFKFKEKVSYAPFLRNMASYPNPNKPVPSLLMDGSRVFGKVALVRFVSDPNNSEDYGELNSITYRIAASERSAK